MQFNVILAKPELAVQYVREKWAEFFSSVPLSEVVEFCGLFLCEVCAEAQQICKSRTDSQLGFTLDWVSTLQVGTPEMV